MNISIDDTEIFTAGEKASFVARSIWKYSKGVEQNDLERSIKDGKQLLEMLIVESNPLSDDSSEKMFKDVTRSFSTITLYSPVMLKLQNKISKKSVTLFDYLGGQYKTLSDFENNKKNIPSANVNDLIDLFLFLSNTYREIIPILSYSDNIDDDDV